jgi:hypothetical protein
LSQSTKSSSSVLSRRHWKPRADVGVVLSLPVKVNRALALFDGSVGRSTMVVSGAPGEAVMVHTTTRHCAGSALPDAWFPPPSTVPWTAMMPQPSLRVTTFPVTVWPASATAIPSPLLPVATLPTTRLPSPAGAAPATSMPEPELPLTVLRRTTLS